MTSVRLQNKLVKIDRGLASRHERTRWQAAIALGKVAESDPESVWILVERHGSRRHKDVRVAIATCVLEHLLEYHFDAFFPRVSKAVKGSRWFRDTFSYCYQLGQASLPRNGKRFRKLQGKDERTWQRLQKLLREAESEDAA
jgi:hypothetical protein